MSRPKLLKNCTVLEIESLEKLKEHYFIGHSFDYIIISNSIKDELLENLTLLSFMMPCLKQNSKIIYHDFTENT